MRREEDKQGESKSLNVSESKSRSGREVGGKGGVREGSRGMRKGVKRRGSGEWVDVK